MKKFSKRVEKLLEELVDETKGMRRDISGLRRDISELSEEQFRQFRKMKSHIALFGSSSPATNVSSTFRGEFESLYHHGDRLETHPFLVERPE